MKRTCSQWVCVVIAVLVAGGSTTTAVASGLQDFYTPLTIRIVGADGDRTFELVTGGEGETVTGIVGRLSAPWSVGVVAPAGIQAPGLTDFYEIVLTQGGNAKHRLPWYGMPTAQFFYYPARGSIPAYVRLHMGKVSEPVYDAWLIADPSLTSLVEDHLNGLGPIRPQAQRSPHIATWVWLGFAPLLVVGILILLRRWTSSSLVFGGRPLRSPQSKDLRC